MRNRSRSDPRLRHLPDEKITAEKATSMAGVGLFHIKLILISGLVWMARGFDSVVMRFVSSLLSCSWRLDRRQGAILDGITLFSTILGCIMYGIWSDKYGRKKAFYSVLFLFIFGVLSAASPNFIWFVTFRALAAFSVGGLYQTLVLCLESFPGRKRGQVVYTLAAFWALSVIIMQYILFSTTMRGHGWKLFVAIGTLPALIAACLMMFYPESFRFRMVEGKYAAANDIMVKMLKGSGKKVTAQLLELPEMRPRKLVQDFLMLPCEGYFFWLLTLGLLTSICYRGLVDWPENTPITDLDWPPPKKYVEHGFSKVPGRHYEADSMDKLIDCIKFIDVGDLQLMTCTTALDFPAYVMYLILADLVNRKILMTASYVLSSICCFLLFTLYMLALYYDISGAQYLFAFTCFCARTLLLGQHDLLLLMVAEAFPTSHRGMAVGLEVAIFYLGEILGYVLLADLLMFWGPLQYAIFLMYGGLLIFCLLVSWRKLEESRGKELKVIMYTKFSECSCKININDAKITAEEATNTAGVGLFHIKLIIISGLVWMALGFESVVIRFVTPLLSCSWELELWHGAILDSVMLFSTLLGSILYGIWSDKYGRKTAFYSVLVLFIFGVLSAAATNFKWFAIFRAVAAFSVGGLYQTLVLCLESSPGNKRGQVVYTLAAFWILSIVIMQHVLFSTMMDGYSWKVFVVFGTLPALLAGCLMRFYPESFRYRMVKEEYVSANDILGKMLKGSGKKVTVQLLQLPQMRPRKLVLDFFRRPLVRSSILLWILGLLTSICHRGLVDLPEHSQADYPLKYETPKIVEHGFSKVPSTHYMYNNMTTLIDCIKIINLEEFKFITWTTALDFPAFVIYLILADLINRKILLTASYVLSSICCFVLFGLYAVPEDFTGFSTLFIGFSYCTRTVLLAQHDLILLIVAEAFPTSHRGTAVGLEVAIFYLGQFFGYLILVGLLRALMLYWLFLYGVVLFICSIACCRRLGETRGKGLKDIIESPTEENVEEY